MWSYCTCRKISLNFVRKLGIWHSTGIYSQTAVKSNSYLFWLAVYFVFQKKVWKSCGSYIPANAKSRFQSNIHAAFAAGHFGHRRDKNRFPRFSRIEIASRKKKKATSHFISSFGLWMDEKRGKSIFRVLPSYVC